MSCHPLYAGQPSLCWAALTTYHPRPSYALSLCRLSGGCKINTFIHFCKKNSIGRTAVSVWTGANTNTVLLLNFFYFQFFFVFIFPVCKHIKGVSLWKWSLHTLVRDILEFPATFLSHVLRHIGRWLPRMCRYVPVRCDSLLSDLSHWGDIAPQVLYTLYITHWADTAPRVVYTFGCYWDDTDSH